MSDLKLDVTTGDLDLTGGDISLTTGKDTIEQHIRSTLRAFKGEWFLDLDKGVPYYQEVFRKNQSPVVVDAIFKEAILGCQGVIELTAFDIKVDTVTRKLLLTFSCETFEGEVSFENLEV